MAKGWTVENIPDQTGKTILVTGANSGLGYETALALAGKGARVLVACRDLAKGRDAEARIRAAHPRAAVAVLALDLASLDDVRRAAVAVHPRRRRACDVLVNNAGVMALPYRRTRDGFEMQLGTNHLGHVRVDGARARSPARHPGGAHRDGQQRIPSTGGDPLRRSAVGARLLASGPPTGRARSRTCSSPTSCNAGSRRRVPATISVAAHPGYAATNLQFAGPRMEGSSLAERFSAIGNRLFAQSAAMGALPQLYAATAPDVRGGDYFGPSGIGELWGAPRKVDVERALERRERGRPALEALRAADRRSLRRARVRLAPHRRFPAPE